MRIAVVTSLFPSPPRPREGVFAEERWRRMKERGHEPSVIHPQPHAPPLARGSWAEIAAMPAREVRAGLDVVRPRYWHVPGRAAGNARRFARGAWRALERPDVVVCDYAWPAAAIAERCARAGLACVVNGRGSDVLQVAGEAGLRVPLARALRAAGTWCAVSADLVRAMDEIAGRPGVGRLVPNGVDAARFHPRDRAACRAQLGIGAGALVLVVGHWIPRKDPLLALAAFAAGAPPDARLWFVGRGPLEGELRAEVESAGLGERVRLVGERTPDELAELYGAADLLLSTSRREGRPNVVLEALASGRPVLATAAGGTEEVLDDPRMLARERDPARLGGMLAALLADPPAPRELARRVAGLTWEASLDALERVLEQARERAAGARP